MKKIVSLLLAVVFSLFALAPVSAAEGVNNTPGISPPSVTTYQAKTGSAGTPPNFPGDMIKFDGLVITEVSLDGNTTVLDSYNEIINAGYVLVLYKDYPGNNETFVRKLTNTTRAEAGFDDCTMIAVKPRSGAEFDPKFFHDYSPMSVCTLTVTSPEPAELEVNAADAKTSYTAGEKLNTTGLSVKLVYKTNIDSDGAVKAETKAYTTNPGANTSLTASNTSVTVTYSQSATPLTGSYNISVKASQSTGSQAYRFPNDTIFVDQSAIQAKSTKKEYTVTAKTLNMRSGPGTAYKKVGKLKNGDIVSVTGFTENNWASITFNNASAYISGDFITPAVTSNAGSAQYLVIARRLNVRSGPGLGCGVIGKLTRGAAVEVIECIGSWAKIKYGDSIAYVSLAYLVKK